MAQRGEQSIPRRRSRGNTGDAGITLQQQMTGRVAPPQTDSYENADYQADVYTEEPLQRSSVVRRNTTDAHPYRPSSTSMQVAPGTGSAARRLSGTRDIPSHQPRYPMPQPSALPPEPVKPRHTMHWLLPVGVGMIAMLLLWVLG